MGKDPLAALTPLCEALLGDSRDALGDAPPSRVLLMPGSEVVWDNCGNRGQLWVRVVSVVPHYPSGLRTNAMGVKCGPAAWDATIAVGVLRCVSTVDDRGRPPKALTMTKEMTQILDDASKISGVLVEAEEITEITVWNPLGPEGGLAGGEWEARARFGIT